MSDKPCCDLADIQSQAGAFASNFRRDSAMSWLLSACRRPLVWKKQLARPATNFLGPSFPVIMKNIRTETVPPNLITASQEERGQHLLK